MKEASRRMIVRETRLMNMTKETNDIRDRKQYLDVKHEEHQEQKTQRTEKQKLNKKSEHAGFNSDKIRLVSTSGGSCQ